MNERLKEEIELWKHKRCSYDEHGDISATAQHFYNLALEDVDKYVESLTTNAHEMPDNHPEKLYCIIEEFRKAMED